MPVKRCRGHDQNGGIDQESEVEGQARVEKIEAQRGFQACGRPVDGARLHERGMQVKVVRHDGRAQHADRDVKHLAVLQDRGPGHKAARNAEEVGPRQNDFDQVAKPDRADERDHDRFEIAEALLLQVEDRQDVERRQANAPKQRNMKEQVQRDGGADDLGQIACRNGNFATHPQGQARAARVVVATGLRQIALRHQPEPRGEGLQQDRHQIRHQQHEHELVSEARASGDVGGPVARVHVAHRHQESGSGKGQELPPEAGAGRNADAAVHLAQRGDGGSFVVGDEPLGVHAVVAFSEPPVRPAWPRGEPSDRSFRNARGRLHD